MSRLPKGWESTNLSDIADIKCGLAKSKNRDPGAATKSVPFLRVANVQRGYLDLGIMHEIEATEAEIKDLELQPGDVLLNEGGDRDKLGRGWVWAGKIPLCIHQNHVFRARPKHGVVDPYYLSYWANTPEASAYFLSSGTQTTNLASINKSNLSRLPVPLPPLPEQRRIAAILDQAEALRSMRRAALAKLDTLAQSIFIEMFGDTVTNPRKLPVTELGSLILDGPQNGLYKPSELYGAGTPILRIDGFYAGVVTGLAQLKRVKLTPSEVATYGLRANDLVVNRVNSPEYLGKCALIPELPEPTVFESNMMRFSVDEVRVHPRYLVQVLQGASIRVQILGCAKHAINQSSINQKDVGGFRLQLPPIQEQRLFAERMTRVEKQAVCQQEHLKGLEILFASLQHRAFRGEL